MLSFQNGEGKDLFIEPQTECSVHCSDSLSAESYVSKQPKSTQSVTPRASTGTEGEIV